MPRQGRARAIASLAVVLAVAATASVIYSNRADTHSPYDTDPVRRGDLIQYVRGKGDVAPRSVVAVGSRISGTIVEIHVDINEPVKRDQKLALIDPYSYQQKLQQARSELSRVQAARELLELKERKYRTLLDKGITTQLDYEEVRTELKQAISDTTTKGAAVRDAENDLSYCTIRSKIDGVLLDRKVNVGETVQVSTSVAPVLFFIAEDLKKMRIVVPIQELDIGRVQPGQEVQFTVVAIHDRTFHGRVVRIHSPYTPQQGQQQQFLQPQPSAPPSFDVVIDVDNDDLALKPRFTAKVAIVVDKDERVLLIPNSALRVKSQAADLLPKPPQLGAGETNENVAVVYRMPRNVSNGKPEAVVVKLGKTDNTSTEVISGLEEGDTVVTGIKATQEAKAQ